MENVGMNNTYIKNIQFDQSLNAIAFSILKATRKTAGGFIFNQMHFCHSFFLCIFAV